MTTEVYRNTKVESTELKLKSLRLPMPLLGNSLGFRDRVVWAHREKFHSLFDDVPSISQTCDYIGLERHAVSRAVSSLTDRGLLNSTGQPVVPDGFWASRDLAKGEADTPFNRIRFFPFHPSADPSAFPHAHAALYCRLHSWQEGKYSFKKLGDQVGLDRLTVQTYMDALSARKICTINRFFERGDFKVKVEPIHRFLELFAKEEKKETEHETTEEKKMLLSFARHCIDYGIPENMAKTIAGFGVAKQLNALEFSTFVNNANEKNKETQMEPHCGKLVIYRFKDWESWCHLTKNEQVYPMDITNADLYHQPKMKIKAGPTPKRTIAQEPAPSMRTQEDPEPEHRSTSRFSSIPVASMPVADEDEDTEMTTCGLEVTLAGKYRLDNYQLVRNELRDNGIRIDPGAYRQVLTRVYRRNPKGNLATVIAETATELGAVLEEVAA